MTAPRDFPPSPETLAAWAQWLVVSAHARWLDSIHHDDQEAGEENSRRMETIEAFLRDERLAAALALWEAVDLLGQRGEIRWDIPAFRPFKSWRIARHYQSVGVEYETEDGDTLPEAVSALKAKLAGEEPSRG